jgi:uncharacterized protein (TIGR00251 family)
MDLFEGIINKHESGVTIDIFVTPNSEKSIFPAGINKWRKRIDIKVRSKAKDNLANLEVIKLIAGFFNKQVKDVYVLTGKKTKEKTILIENISEKTALKIIKESIDGL